jgi:uncharacterized protein YegP (UPF0339 family)
MLRPVFGRYKETPRLASRFEIKKRPGGQYHFVLKAANGEIIATSEIYTSTAGAKNGIDSVKTNAPSAPVVDLTGE